MGNVVIPTVVIPAFVSVVLYLVFVYLYEQSRQAYFRAWKLAWAFYSMHYALDLFPPSVVAFLVSQLLLVGMALCIFISSRLMRNSYSFRWYDAAVGGFGLILVAVNFAGHMAGGVFHPEAYPPIRLGMGIAAVLLYTSAD
jgi:hypothetical protein